MEKNPPSLSTSFCNGLQKTGEGRESLTGVPGSEVPKDPAALAQEFQQLVTQMAFEKFDFHQWFRFSSTMCSCCQ